jgi:hypothetical protein
MVILTRVDKAIDLMDRIYDSRRLKVSIWAFLIFAMCFFGVVIFHIINR